MRDINEPLRVAYAGYLTQVPGVPVFYQFLPNNVDVDNYMVFRSINSNDASTKTNAETNTNITVEIHTKSNIANRGLTADQIADLVYSLIYPSKQFNILMSRGRVVWTQLSNDVVQNFEQRNQFGYISRFITFLHRISADDTGTGGTTPTTATGQIFRYEYTGSGGEVGFTDGQLVNKRIIEVNKDGISFSPIITGTPTGKQAKYDTNSGGISFDIPFEPGEESYVLYQLLNPNNIYTFDYAAAGGETSISDSILVNVNVYAVIVDGVSSSKILNVGVPANKEVLYEATLGKISFGPTIEPIETVKVLYQLN